MIRNYYTLVKLVKALQLLENCKIVECFTQDKNTLLFALYDGNRLMHLNFSADTRLAALYIRNNFARAKRNSVDLFDLLLGQRIKKIELAANDRIITIETNDYRLYFILFGGARNNLVICNKDNRIVDAFKSGKKLKGDVFSIERRKERAEDADISLFDYISRGDYHFGKYYADEFCRKYDLNCRLSLRDAPSVDEKIKEFINILHSAEKYYLLKNDKGELLLSLIPLAGWHVVEKFTNISEAIERRIRKELIEGNIEKEKKSVLKRCRLIEKRLENSISAIKQSEKQLQRAAKYRQWAQLLMMQTEQKSKPGKSITVTDYEGNKIEIPLDEKVSINENARRYFEKAKDSEANIKIRQNILPSLIEKLEKVREVIDKIEETDSVKKLKHIKEEYADILGGDNQNDEAAQRFRTFDLGEGYILYVGKNAANNDELTLRFAKPNDLWFHARGTSGSHAVLRMNKPEKPPKYILKAAAAVAAYYSGAKNAKYVPVSYTFKKFVHKPKGANPGSVVIKREEVIMVEPKLPQPRQ